MVEEPGRLNGEARAALRRWFAKNAADLPWRREREPYRVWLAEVMLTQTRVPTVLRYYERFLAAFPTVACLAAAQLDAALKAWEGLGYYARARNLHRAARQLQENGGVMPKTHDEWRALPGIGPYCAAAIASITAGEARAAVDGNVRRVLARLLDEPGDIRQGKTQRALARAAQQWLDPTRPGRHNEALMELGQRICRPRAPRCEICPLRPHCLAHARGTVSRRPFRSARRQPRPELQLGAWIEDGQGRILLRQRAADERLGRLWTFPGGRSADPHLSAAAAAGELARLLRAALGCEAEVGEWLAQAPLRISGICGSLQLYRATLPAGYRLAADGLRWLDAAGRARVTLPRAERSLLASLAAPLSAE